MRPLTPIPPAAARGQFARSSELLKAGVPKWRLYARDVSHPVHGVVAAPGFDPLEFGSRVRAIRQVMSPGVFLSRRTAATILGLPVDRGRETLEIGAIRPKRPLRHRGCVGHQIQPGVLREVPRSPDWLPRPAEVWGTLAAVCSVDELVVVGDALVSGPSRRAVPLCSIEELQESAQRFRGCVGVGLLRASLPLIRTGVESPAETRTRLIIARAGHPTPQTCCPVPVAGRILHADLGYPQWKIAIEYEGEYHFTGGLEQARRDTERHEAMKDAGWTVLRVTALDLRDPRRFLARLARAIAKARAV